MTNSDRRTIFLCSCDGTMDPPEALAARVCPGSRIEAATQLCRAELARLEAALGQGPVTIGCRQEGPVFREAAEARDHADALDLVDLRGAGGWSETAAAAGPKLAALVAAAAEPTPEFALASMESTGVTLIYAQADAAFEAAAALKDRLDLTILLAAPGDIVPPAITEVPFYRGRIVSAKGHLGAFELTVNGFAHPAPSSRRVLQFGAARDGATSRADIIIDLSGGTPLFPAAELRSGYLRADPRDPAAVARCLLAATGLVGTFDKPRYVSYEASICAHSRSRKTGCTRCLDACPTGAITPAGDHVAFDAQICAGCGACAALCPTGAAGYALPPADALMRRLRTLLRAYRDAGGRDGVILFHDEAHGAPLIDALARYGAGLPANVLPVTVNETTQIGVETVAAGLAFGAAGLVFLTRARPRHPVAALETTVALAKALATPLGYGADGVRILATDDPDELGRAIRTDAGAPERAVADFMPLGNRKSLLRESLAALHMAAPTPTGIVPLPAGAPFGTVSIDTSGCTLCLACVSACPANALLDNPERPELRFREEACVQCGLCAATCPEKVITLIPRVDFGAFGREPIVIKAEEPFHCIRCAKPFGVKSTVERIAGKLAERHWMFQGEGRARLDLVRMCDDCRAVTVTTSGFDPYAGTPRPRPRSAEDYRERDGD